MKRSNAPYIRHQLHRLFVASMLAVAALALLGKAAHAQPSASCAEGQVSGARNGSKTACKAQGAGEDTCNAEVGGFLDLVQGLLDVEADGAHAECDGSFAGVLESTCLGFN